MHIHTPYHAISLLHKFVLVVSLLRAFTPHFAFAVCVAVRILPGSADYDPRQFHCCINGCIIAACIYSPFRFFCVCGCSHFTLLHKFVLVVSLLRAFTPHFAFAVCVAVRILPSLVDYDPIAA